MSPFTKRTFFLLAVTTFFLHSFSGTARAKPAVTTTHSGSLADGATYVIEVPADWNGTLFLYSHGYVVPGTPNPAQDVSKDDPFTRAFLLGNHYALAGSSYATTGWAIEDALRDQIAVLDIFNLVAGPPKRTIAWGHSLGGIIAAGLIQRHPGRFDGALPMCGVLSGGVATWNTAVDSEFAFKNLIALGTGLQVVHISNPHDNFILAKQLLAAAQVTQSNPNPQGRARLALVSALGDGPGWFNPSLPEPAPTDFVTQEMNQFLWDKNVDFPFVFAFRAELEARAGGNVSWNTGVDYSAQLARSIDRNEVQALYEQAGLDLEADLNTLNDTARISADPDAFRYLKRYLIFNAEIRFPVLTLHTKGDGLVVVQNESAYLQVVEEAGNQEHLRRTFVDRAGNRPNTPTETIVGGEKLIDQIVTGVYHVFEGRCLS